ncbi:GSCOCG00000381001-RA-CDS [Cotesia congregata]|uniref:Uncharacterized protein n=1 Tax=Cotesia congregata TaxID=51543 RepID=A0A8J2H9P5_COTCN|nr:GSCOCG00000381001-RA-CDS [Cotesia congregata]CAG5088167.1 Protein of unknown function [Cotesia congregata]
MSIKSSDKVPSRRLNYPKTKVKHIKCYLCSTNFYLSDHPHIKKRLPVLLNCGHTICDSCSRLEVKKSCAACADGPDPAAGGDNDVETLFPMNVYVHGLVYLYKSKPHSNVRPIKDDTFKFEKSLKAQINDVEASVVADFCNECSSVATAQCLGCNNAYFCSSCFTQVHQHKVNKNHEKLVINPPKTNAESRSVTCSIHLTNCLTEWCIDCKKPCCEKCVAQSHSSHNLQLLHTMNQSLQEELQDVYGRVRDMLNNVYTSQSVSQFLLI